MDNSKVISCGEWLETIIQKKHIARTRKQDYDNNSHQHPKDYLLDTNLVKLDDEVPISQLEWPILVEDTLQYSNIAGKSPFPMGEYHHSNPQ